MSAEGTRELDTLQHLAAAKMSLRAMWRQYSSYEGAVPQNFAKFIETWSSRSYIRASEFGAELPLWRLRELLMRPDTDEADAVIMQMTAAGRREFPG